MRCGRRLWSLQIWLFCWHVCVFCHITGFFWHSQDCFDLSGLVVIHWSCFSLRVIRLCDVVTWLSVRSTDSGPLLEVHGSCGGLRALVRTALHAPRFICLGAILQSCFSRFYKHELLFWNVFIEAFPDQHGSFDDHHIPDRVSVCWTVFLFICEESLSLMLSISWLLHYSITAEIIPSSLQQHADIWSWRV